MAKNNVFYDFTGNPTGVVIDTTTAPLGVNKTTNAPDVDDIRITSNGGTGPITQLTLNAGSGNDTATFSGSPNNVEARMGEGADILNVQTALLGGSIVSSTFIGGPGNDTFNIIANGAGAANTRFNGNEGADNFNLGGAFSQTTVAGSTGRDLVQFTKNSTFTSGFIGGGADDDIIRDDGFTVDFSATTLVGGGGDDLIDVKNSTVGTGTDGLTTKLGSGDDTFFGTKVGENSVEGGSGDDFIQTFAGDDSILAGDGADTVFSGQGDDFVFGGAGHDIIFGEQDEDTLNGGGGTDIVYGGTNDDLIFGGPDGDLGDDTLIGGSGDDTVVASSGDNWIFGDGFRSTNPGGTNSTFIDANFTSAFGIKFSQVNGSLAPINPTTFTTIDPPFGSGFSTGSEYFFNVNPDLNPLAVAAGTQTPTAAQINYWNNDLRDTLLDNIDNNPVAGDDSLVGNSGDDVIFGGGGDDDISGANGDDTLIGGTGFDTMSGGSGNDLFIQELGDSALPFDINVSFSSYNITFDNPFTAVTERPDVITDFEARNTSNQVVDQISFEPIPGIPLGFQQSLRNNIGDPVGFFLAGEVVLYSGTYNENNGTFITSADTLGPDGQPLDVLAFRAAFGAPPGVVALPNFLGSNAVVLLDAADQAFNNTFGNAGVSNFV